MFGRFWGSARPKENGDASSIGSVDESQTLEDAMRGVLHIMNDDVDLAEEHLAKGFSAFHVLGRGLTIFLRATLGFEQEVMREAAHKLNHVETLCGEKLHKKQKEPAPSQTAIYPPGTEYSVAAAEAQLMGAVLAVLNESLSEGIRGFYKLRRANATLSGILEAEKRYVEGRGATNAPATEPATTTTAGGGGKLDINGEKGQEEDEDEDEDEFVDVAETLDQKETPATYQGHLEARKPTEAAANTAKASSPAENGPAEEAAGEGRPSLLSAPTGLEQGPDQTLFASNRIDEFIHAGSNLCFGVLLLIISLIPPAFATLLKIVGFTGDRDRGLALLWQASKSRHDIHGAFAGLVLCGYYNAVMGFCDIVPADAYPRERCQALVRDMRARFPQSRLWLLEEARMLAGERQPELAARLIAEQEKSRLKQVEALQWFERSLNCMCMHDFAGCAESFLKCVSLNNWSHALYYYIAGAAHVEMYREARRGGDAAAAERHGREATELLRKVPAHTGKKRFLARQLPFEEFVARKLAKWEERARAWQCELVEAVGVSPLEEMTYFWNGYKRMRAEHVERSLDMLAWSESAANEAHWARERLDERAILALLRAACLRNLGRRDEARRLLQAAILRQPRAAFKAGGLRDGWTCPVAHYEMAIVCFQDWDGSAADADRLAECAGWLDKVAGWGSYDLDARMGMRVTTAQETLKKSRAAVALDQ